MKEMEYKPDMSICDVLDQGEYKGVRYVILSKGTHPTAYVENIVNATDVKDVILNGIYPHGGFSFCNLPYWDFEPKIWLGWDYAHICDYSPFVPKLNGKRWTTQEILDEVHKIIEQLLERI